MTPFHDVTASLQKQFEWCLVTSITIAEIWWDSVRLKFYSELWDHLLHLYVYVTERDCFCVLVCKRWCASAEHLSVFVQEPQDRVGWLKLERHFFSFSVLFWFPVLSFQVSWPLMCTCSMYSLLSLSPLHSHVRWNMVRHCFRVSPNIIQ